MTFIKWHYCRIKMIWKKCFQTILKYMKSTWSVTQIQNINANALNLKCKCYWKGAKCITDLYLKTSKLIHLIFGRSNPPWPWCGYTWTRRPLLVCKYTHIESERDHSEAISTRSVAPQQTNGWHNRNTCIIFTKRHKLNFFEK